MSTYRWIESDVPIELEIRQVYGFIFDLDGRILILDDEGIYNLPGGRPENGESTVETLIREVREEVQVSIASIEYLGYQLIDGDEKFAQVRLICQVEQIFPIAEDPSTGRIYKRIWIQPSLANDLLGWGKSGGQQIDSAIESASKWRAK